MTGFNYRVWAQDKSGNYLLTEIRITNPKYSIYKDTPILKTGGDYFASPTFDKTFIKAGESGTINNPTAVLERGVGQRRHFQRLSSPADTLWNTNGKYAGIW